MVSGVLAHDVLSARPTQNWIAGLHHFDLGPGTPQSPAALLAAGVSLYGFDDDLGVAFFVRTDPDADLVSAPFLYRAQQEHVQQVLTVPYEELVAIGETLPAPDRPALLYSVGRCGSTLLSQALGEIAERGAGRPTLVSLSEPDLYTYVVGMRDPDGSRDDELVALLRAGTRFLAHAFPADRLLVKFRGWGVQAADLVARALPDARSLFLTRDLDGWLQSMHRLKRLDDPAREAEFVVAGSAAGAPRRMYHYDRRRFIPELADPPAGRLEDVALTYVSLTRTFLRLHEAGLVPHSISYAGLCADPIAAVRAVATVYELPTDGIRSTPAAFGRDSQEGSSLSGRAARRSGVVDLSRAHLDRAAAYVSRLGVDPTGVEDLPGNLARPPA